MAESEHAEQKPSESIYFSFSSSSVKILQGRVFVLDIYRPSFLLGHVTFAADTHLEPDHVHVVSDGTAYHLPEAHIGILRNHHTYHVDIPVTHDLGEDIVLDQPNYNLYVRLLESGETQRVEQGGTGQYSSMVKVEVRTMKEGRIREKIFLSSATDADKKMEVSGAEGERGDSSFHSLSLALLFRCW